MHTYIDLHTYHHPASRRFSPAPTTPAPPHRTTPHHTARTASAHTRAWRRRPPTIAAISGRQRSTAPMIIGAVGGLGSLCLWTQAGSAPPHTHLALPQWQQPLAHHGLARHHPAALGSTIAPPPRPPDACDAMAHNATTTTTNPPKHTMSTTGSTHAGKYFCAACARRA
jgi:hypothetical protein